jgi:phenylpropionate dioxygenase-like ring-hydroxylating dioxygenase large terminal subunit
MNRISDGTRVVAAFVPIDDENTMMYVRLYQNSVKIPVLREIFNWISRFGNRVILRQDRRVVQTQIPKISSLTMNEVLLQGDRPIIEYRRKRKELQNMP